MVGPDFVQFIPCLFNYPQLVAASSLRPLDYFGSTFPALASDIQAKPIEQIFDQVHWAYFLENPSLVPSFVPLPNDDPLPLLFASCRHIYRLPTIIVDQNAAVLKGGVIYFLKPKMLSGGINIEGGHS